MFNVVMCSTCNLQFVVQMMSMYVGRQLERVGLANQTTMLRDETMALGKLLERTMIQKHGPAAIKNHFMVMDTICDATQACLRPAWLCSIYLMSLACFCALGVLR
jgi:4-hydroxy-3-methylbut-2-enyl diphosphate reductase IspH